MPKRRGLMRCLIFICLVLLPFWASAEEKEKPKPRLEEKVSRTQHVLTLDGQKIAYTAAAGTLILRGEDGAPRAAVFSVA